MADGQTAVIEYNTFKRGKLVDEAFFSFKQANPEYTLEGNNFTEIKTPDSDDAALKFNQSGTEINDQTDNARIATSVIRNNTDVKDVQTPDGTVRTE